MTQLKPKITITIQNGEIQEIVSNQEASVFIVDFDADFEYQGEPLVYEFDVSIVERKLKIR